MEGSFPVPLLSDEAKALVAAYLPELQAAPPAVPDESSAQVAQAVEWIVDVADEHGAWFIGTAYQLDASSKTLHVAIPDNVEPTWEGDVALHPRSIKLLECCDDTSSAAFNRILLSSAMEVDWELEFVEVESGAWERGQARLYVSLGGFLLVQRLHDSHECIKLSTADEIRFVRCGKLGREEYEHLLRDGLVEQAEEGQGDGEEEQEEDVDLDDDALASLPPSVWPTKSLQLTRKGQELALVGLVRDMQLLLEDTLFYNEEARQEAHGSLRQFRDFVLQGDLLTGAKLLDTSHAQDIAQRRAVAELSLATFERTLVRTLAARPETKDLAKQVKAVTAAAAEASLPAAAEHARVVEELLKERAELRDELRNAQDEVQDLEARLEQLEARRRKAEKRLGRQSRSPPVPPSPHAS